jgi:hypothetical protein
VDRTRVWLALSPLMAAGVLASHALASRITDTQAGSLHAYLDHAPQVLFVAMLVGLLVAATSARLSRVAAWPFPVAAVATFATQEHVERISHTGEVPWLLTSRTFLVGLLLQIPVALVSWWLARRLLAALDAAPARRRALPRLLLELPGSPGLLLASVARAQPRGRGPPLLHRP